MTRRIQVKFENGVLVPQEKISFPEHQDFTVILDDQFPKDPAPDGGLELLEWFSRHRIELDPQQAQHIAESAEYIDQEPDDAS